MSANQCRRNYLPPPQIYEPFAVCSLRADPEGGNAHWDQAIRKCCTTPVKGYQCWNYCGVEESNFPTWLACIHEVTNSTSGSACQRADESPVWTATGPYPSSYTVPLPPATYVYPSTTHVPPVTTSVSPPTSIKPRNNATKVTSTTAPLLTGIRNGTNSTHSAISLPTNVITGGSSKALELSMGAMMCTFLIISTLAL